MRLNPLQRFILKLLMFCFLAGPGYAGEAHLKKIKEKAKTVSKKEKVNVLFFELKALGKYNKTKSKLLENIILAELYKYKKFNVISKSDVEKILNAEEFKMMMACSDNSCLMEVSGALGAEILVSGDIGAMETITQLSMQMMSNQDGHIYSRISKTIEGSNKVLIQETKNAVAELLKGYDPSIGLILSTKIKPENKIAVEDPSLKQVESDSGSDSVFSKWWFWTGLGVLAAGGAAAALLGGSKDDGGSSGGGGGSSPGVGDGKFRVKDTVGVGN